MSSSSSGRRRSSGGTSSLMKLFEPPPGGAGVGAGAGAGGPDDNDGGVNSKKVTTTTTTRMTTSSRSNGSSSSNSCTTTTNNNSMFQQHVLEDGAAMRSSLRFVSDDKRVVVDEEENNLVVNNNNNDLLMRSTVLHANSSRSRRCCLEDSTRSIVKEATATGSHHHHHHHEEKTERTVNGSFHSYSSINNNNNSSSIRSNNNNSSSETHPLLQAPPIRVPPRHAVSSNGNNHHHNKKKQTTTTTTTTTPLQELFFAPSPASAPTPKTQNSRSIPPPPPPLPSGRGGGGKKPPMIPSSLQQQQQLPPNNKSSVVVPTTTQSKHQRMQSIFENQNGIAASSANQQQQQDPSSWWTRQRRKKNKFLSILYKFSKRHHYVISSSTFIGSFMYVFYHVVFCLAMGSSLTRPSHPSPSMIGLMAKITASGIIFTSAPYLLWIGNEIPAMYPTVDLFLAPFLAKLAVQVDTVLSDSNVTTDLMDVTFLATFTTLSSIGMLTSAIFIALGSTFKLANLGTFLPFPVLCGFFTAVGILLWQLAFKVDAPSNVNSISSVISSNDPTLWLTCFIHHVPSIFIATLMKWLGPKNPMMVTMLVLCTILMFHLVMLVTGTTLQQAQQKEWFWSFTDLVYYHKSDDDTTTTTTTIGFEKKWFLPPAPFGVWNSMTKGYVHLGALKEGIPTVFALSFLYLLRCSLHATALKKNVANLVMKRKEEVVVVKKKNKKKTKKKKKSDDDDTTTTAAAAAAAHHHHGTTNTSMSPTRVIKTTTPTTTTTAASHRRLFSEAVDLEATTTTTTGIMGNSSDRALGSNKEQQQQQQSTTTTTTPASFRIVRPRPPQMSTNQMLISYSYSFLASTAVGSFGVTPSIAVGATMYSIGAGGLGPQWGSIVLLIGFYLTNFELVGYIPKTAFSSLIVLASFDMILTFLFKSYHKTKEKLEWVACPIIVVFAFVVGLLPSVFLGIAISTFLFVASFFRSGVVKYVSTGLTIRSTIQRNMDASNWLDLNADRIQVLVLQNYLFFGNASSILTYIESMFEEEEEEENDDDDSLLRLSMSSSSSSSLSSLLGENNNNNNNNTTTRSSMGSDASSSSYTPPLAPMPTYLILDLTLVTGMDTSTVDIFQDIKNLCTMNDCKLFVSGISSHLKETLALGGFKADHPKHKEHRQVRFFADLDFAVGKAEDYLLENDYEEDAATTTSFTLDGGCGDYTITDDHVGLGLDNDDNGAASSSLTTPTTTTTGGITARRYQQRQNGFRHALRQIDQQHDHGDDSKIMELMDLFVYTTPLELEPGERLYACDGGSVQDYERGLFFIEYGIMKLERDPNMTLTMTRGSSLSLQQQQQQPPFELYSPNESLNRVKARTGTVAKQLQRWKEKRRALQARNGSGAGGTSTTTTKQKATTTTTSIRLARIGPGWVVGTMEELSGGTTMPGGIQTAVTKCRLHHLPFERIRHLEEENPMLVLRLYKLLSLLMAKRQEITVGQLSMMRSIVTSSANQYSKPMKQRRVPSKSHLNSL